MKMIAKDAFDRNSFELFIDYSPLRLQDPLRKSPNASTNFRQSQLFPIRMQTRTNLGMSIGGAYMLDRYGYPTEDGSEPWTCKNRCLKN